MSEPKSITYAELMKEVDKIEGKSELYCADPTELQMKFITKCRSKNPPLSFEQIRVLWNKMEGWRPYRNAETLRKVYIRNKV